MCESPVLRLGCASRSPAWRPDSLGFASFSPAYRAFAPLLDEPGRRRAERLEAYDLGVHVVGLDIEMDVRRMLEFASARTDRAACSDLARLYVSASGT